MSRQPLLAILVAFLLPVLVAGCEKTPRPKTGTTGAIELFNPLAASSEKLIAMRADSHIRI